MNTYQALKDAQREELNSFKGMFFAFSNRQFDEGMTKLGLDPQIDQNKICRIGSGGFMLKEQSKPFAEMFARHTQEKKNFLAVPNQLLDALVYELDNHEYGYTGDITDALEALNLKQSEIPKSILATAKGRAFQETA